MVVRGSPATPASIMAVVDGLAAEALRVSAVWSGHWRSRVSLGVAVLRRFPNYISRRDEAAERQVRAALVRLRNTDW
jgi:hypothetical protein